MLPGNLYQENFALLQDEHYNMYKILTKKKIQDMIVNADGKEKKVNDKEELATPMEMDMDQSSDDEEPAFSLSCKVASKTPENYDDDGSMGWGGCSQRQHRGSISVSCPHESTSDEIPFHQFFL